MNKTRVREAESLESVGGFSALVEAGEPVIFRGAVAHWEMVSGWPAKSREWLARLGAVVGHRPVSVSIPLPIDEGYIGTSHLDEDGMEPNALSGWRRFSDVARQMDAVEAGESQGCLYIQSARVPRTLPELAPLVEFPFDVGADLPDDGQWRFWLGVGTPSVLCHYDKPHNLNCVLRGRKHFTLFPPEQISNLYVGPMEGGGYGTPASLVNPVRPDFDAHPRFAEALEHAVHADVGPGDVLFLPTHWWHSVRSVGLCAAANYWWNDLDSRTQAHANAAFLSGLMALRSLPPQWRRAWKAKFDHFVFKTLGDPYAHIPSEFQGYAGEPTPERVERIEQLLRAYANDLLAGGGPEVEADNATLQH